MRYLIDILIALGISVLTLFFFHFFRPKPEVTEIVRVDTIHTTSVDTVFVPIERIKYVDSVIIKEIVIEAPETLILKQRIFEDSLSRIYVSGIEPMVDSVFHFIPRDTFFITETLKPEPLKDSWWKNRFTLSAGVGVGYGLINRKPDVYVGITAGIRLW